MSRCFPFPPPGYERKPREDDHDLLNKETQPEKRDKKEKRDKRKKEGKEIRDKERSEEKQKEKRDKKEKHRERKKDKEKDRDGDKHKSNGFLPDGNRIFGAPEAHLHKPSEKNKEVVSLAEKFSKNNHLAPETKCSQYTPESSSRSTDEEKRSNNKLPDKNVGTKKKKDEGVGDLAGKSALVPKSVGIDQNRIGGIIEKKIEQRMEGKEKIREKEGHDRKGDNRREKDREKPIHRNKDKDKDKKKEEKVTGEQNHVEQPRTKSMLKSSAKDGNKEHFSGAQMMVLQNIARDNKDGGVAPNNLGKRKSIGLNGMYDEHITGSNKLPRTTVSTHPLTGNGKRLETCQNSSAAVACGTQRPPMNIKVDRTFAPDDTQRPPTNIKVDGKEPKINGIIPKSSSQTTSKEKRKSEVPRKVSHPDTKFLSRVLSVPKMDEWSNFDDQEWLFNSQSRNPEVESSRINETPQVWEKALWLDPVDVYALPYVIPH